MKLKHVSLLNVDNTPDFILEQVRDCAVEIGTVLHPLLKKVHPNIALASFAWVHAATIRELVSDDPDQVRKCAALECKALLANIEFLLHNDKKKEGDEDE